MSEEWNGWKEWNDAALSNLQQGLSHLDFADSVQLIQKLLKVIVEHLDVMEAEVKRECP